jgi:hypothetical protein
MTSTLGLDDDLDGVEFVKNIEKAFDIKFTNEEVERTSTVGEFYDLLRRKIPANDADKKCASAMTFYRLRQGLDRMGFGRRLSPSSDLHVLERGRTKSNFKTLEAETGLRLPSPAPTNSSLFGCLAVAVLFCAAPFLFVASGWIVLLIVPAWAAIIWLEPGKLPKDCATLGGLTRRTAALSYGRLIKSGASSSDNEMWKTLIELLSDYALPKSEITRDTVFLQKSAAA